jgi:hypothetical protein
VSDGRLVRVKLKFERNYTQIPNEWLRDVNLSLKARGLLALLMSHDAGYTVTVKSLVATGREGRAAIDSAVAELKENHYLEHHVERGAHGRIEGVIWKLTDPADYRNARSAPQLDFPAPGLSGTRETRQSDNQHLKEAQPEEHLSKELKTAGSTRAGIKEDALPGDSLPVATESPAERYQRLISAKCPGRPQGKPHYWLASGYCEHCGNRQPSLELETTGVSA